MIDLRSDTVTRPSAEMLQAMFKAEVGDDVFGDDPTVIKLEKLGAEIFGKETALFCTSGTMTNQLAIKVHTKPGEEVICAFDSHVFKYEGGGMAMNSSVQARTIVGDLGRISAQQVEENINADDIHFPKTSLVCLENTANRGGGSIYDSAEINKIREVCNINKLALHLDGARIFNALNVTKQSPQNAALPFDSLSVCLSKGLGCPVGSLLIGSRDFIKQAKRIRKAWGGGWRQAGYLAAAGIYAIENNIARLEEDHIHAAIISAAITKTNIVAKKLPVNTNNVMFELLSTIPVQSFLQHLKNNNILATGIGGQWIRFVTHLQITDADTTKVCAAIESFS